MTLMRARHRRGSTPGVGFTTLAQSSDAMSARSPECVLTTAAAATAEALPDATPSLASQSRQLQDIVRQFQRRDARPATAAVRPKARRAA